MLPLAVVAVAAVALVPPAHVTVSPVDAKRNAQVRVTVSGVDASRLEARLLGAETPSGHAMPWSALARRGAGWAGTVATPYYWGVYPVELRAPSGPVASVTSVVRVLPQAFHTRPSFATAAGVAAWWVRTGPPQAALVSAKPWAAPAGTPRNAFNRLLEVRFRLLAPWPPVYPQRATLTMFVRTSRETAQGRWRFVDVGTGP